MWVVLGVNWHTVAPAGGGAYVQGVRPHPHHMSDSRHRRRRSGGVHGPRRLRGERARLLSRGRDRAPHPATVPARTLRHSVPVILRWLPRGVCQGCPRRRWHGAGAAERWFWRCGAAEYLSLWLLSLDGSDARDWRQWWSFRAVQVAGDASGPWIWGSTGTPAESQCPRCWPGASVAWQRTVNRLCSDVPQPVEAPCATHGDWQAWRATQEGLWKSLWGVVNCSGRARERIPWRSCGRTCKMSGLVNDPMKWSMCCEMRNGRASMGRHSERSLHGLVLVGKPVNNMNRSFGVTPKSEMTYKRLLPCSTDHCDFLQWCVWMMMLRKHCTDPVQTNQWPVPIALTCDAPRKGRRPARLPALSPTAGTERRTPRHRRCCCCFVHAGWLDDSQMYWPKHGVIYGSVGLHISCV